MMLRAFGTGAVVVAAILGGLTQREFRDFRAPGTTVRPELRAGTLNSEDSLDQSVRNSG
jgi:hypothetical protein